MNPEMNRLLAILLRMVFLILGFVLLTCSILAVVSLCSIIATEPYAWYFVPLYRYVHPYLVPFWGLGGIAISCLFFYLFRVFGNAARAD